MTGDSEWLTVAQVAEALGCTDRAVQMAAKQGRWPEVEFRREGRSWFAKRESVVAYAERTVPNADEPDANSGADREPGEQPDEVRDKPLVRNYQEARAPRTGQTKHGLVRSSEFGDLLVHLEAARDAQMDAVRQECQTRINALTDTYARRRRALSREVGNLRAEVAALQAELAAERAKRTGRGLFGIRWGRG